MGVNQLKKTLINFGLILTAFFIFFLKSNFFNWFNIAGVLPSLFAIYILFIGLFSNKTIGTIYGIVVGLILDALVSSKIGITAVSLGIIGFLTSIFDKNFSKDSRITIMFMVLGSTIVYELINWGLSYIFISTNVEIINFIKILGIEVVFNLIITIIIYPLIQKCGYYIENEFKGNKLLTRYF